MLKTQDSRLKTQRSIFNVGVLISTLCIVVIAVESFADEPAIRTVEVVSLPHGLNLDLGAIDLDKPTEQIVRLHNKTESKLTFKDVQSSCGCVQASKSLVGKSILPNETMDIPIVLSETIFTGQVAKQVRFVFEEFSQDQLDIVVLYKASSHVSFETHTVKVESQERDFSVRLKFNSKDVVLENYWFDRGLLSISKKDRSEEGIEFRGNVLSAQTVQDEVLKVEYRVGGEPKKREIPLRFQVTSTSGIVFTPTRMSLVTAGEQMTGKILMRTAEPLDAEQVKEFKLYDADGVEMGTDRYKVHAKALTELLFRIDVEITHREGSSLPDHLQFTVGENQVSIRFR
jgi:hypothetical protein